MLLNIFKFCTLTVQTFALSNSFCRNYQILVYFPIFHPFKGMPSLSKVYIQMLKLHIIFLIYISQKQSPRQTPRN